MDWLLFYIWAAAALVPAVHGATSFIRPPNFDRGIDEDPSNNIRHEEGSSITVMWEIDLDKISLVYVQQLDNDRIQSTFLRENVTTTRYTWVAEYDPAGFTTNNEDAIGWFTLNSAEDGPIRCSQRFNVTAPESASTTEAASTTTESTATESTSTTSASSEETSSGSNSESSSELSSGATAGIAVGAVIGGLLVLGGIGFFFWKRSKRQSETSYEPAKS